VDTAQSIAFACMLGFTAAVLVVDVKTDKIPNLLTVPVFAAGLLFHVTAGFCGASLAGAAGGLGFALGGFGVGFGILFLLWLVGGSLGGDVKFMGAVGSWLGAWLTFQILVLSSVFALLCTIGIFAFGALRGDALKARRPIPTLGRAGGRDAVPPRKGWNRVRRSFGVRFGVPAALATWTLLGLKWAGCEIPWPPL
jgi:prepilin peptidase CpaA